MSWNVTHVLVATALLLGPATLGVASHTDTIENAVFGDETAEEAEQLEVFEGEVPDGVTSASLDLRIDRGAVKVVTWDKPRYEIAVLQQPTDGAATGETQTSFQETSEDGELSLELVVDRDGQAPVSAHVQDTSVGDSPQRAIVAHVPANLTYANVFACEGEGYALNSTLPVTGQIGHDECVADDSPGQDQIGYIGYASEDALNVTAGLSGIDGDKAQLAFDNQDVHLADLDLAKLHAVTDNGGVEGSSLAVDTLKVATDNGDVDLTADADEAHVSTDNGQVALAGEIAVLEADTDNGRIQADLPALTEASLVTDNGAIEANVAPADSGDLTAQSDNGRIDVGLAHEDDVGYKATGSAENGGVEIALVDERSSETDVAADDEHDHGEHEAAHTAGYADKAIQFDISAVSDNGEIQIVEETASTDEDAASGSGSSLALAR